MKSRKKIGAKKAKNKVSQKEGEIIASLKQIVAGA